MAKWSPAMARKTFRASGKGRLGGWSGCRHGTPTGRLAPRSEAIRARPGSAASAARNSSTRSVSASQGVSALSMARAVGADASSANRAGSICGPRGRPSAVAISAARASRVRMASQRTKTRRWP